MRPDDMKSQLGELMVESIPSDCGYVLLVGFKQQPPNIYHEIERLGGELLCEVGQSTGGEIGRDDGGAAA
jgi:hypothetical protein